MPGEVSQITWINRHSVASSYLKLKIHEIHLFIFAEAFNLALKQKWGFHVKPCQLFSYNQEFSRLVIINIDIRSS